MYANMAELLMKQMELLAEASKAPGCALETMVQLTAQMCNIYAALMGNK